MFASKVSIYNNETMLGTASGSADRYNRSAPLYTHLKELAALRAANPALADGAQQNRYAADGPGIFAVSRYDREAGVEYIVAANNSTSASTATFATWSQNEQFKPVYGTTSKVKSAKDRSITVTVPPLSVSVWRSSSKVDVNVAAPKVTLNLPAGGVGGRAPLSAIVDTKTFAQATFLFRPVGTKAWQTIGTDDNAPFRVYQDVSALPVGTVLEYRVVVKDAAGRIAAAGGWSSVVKAVGPAPAADNGDPATTQPTAVSVPGTHNTEMGCAADWDPACAQAQLALDPNDKIWKKTFTITPGTYGYKGAIDKSWTENYGAKGLLNGDNISYETVSGKVTFYYDPATHWVTSDAEGPIVTAAGDFQTELGCSADWDPACMRMWLQDKDGDGVYTIATTKIPAGTWSFKTAVGLSWTENYGDGGVPNGSNITFTVPKDGATTTFSYDSATHKTSVTSA